MFPMIYSACSKSQLHIYSLILFIDLRHRAAMHALSARAFPVQSPDWTEANLFATAASMIMSLFFCTVSVWTLYCMMHSDVALLQNSNPKIIIGSWVDHPHLTYLPMVGRTTSGRLVRSCIQVTISEPSLFSPIWKRTEVR